MTARLPIFGQPGHFDPEPEPKHQEAARVLSGAMFGKGAAVARLTGLSERMLQFWMEPHVQGASPFEEVEEITLALRRLSGRVDDDPDAPLALLCRRLGGRFVPDLAMTEPGSLDAEAGQLAREFGDVVHAALAGAGRPEKRLQRFEKEFQELQERLLFLRRRVQIDLSEQEHGAERYRRSG